MKKNGFTLIEIMIAIVLLSLAIVPFIAVLTQNLKASIMTKETYIGSNYAKALAEEIKLRHFGATTLPVPAGSASFDRGTYSTIDDYNDFNEKTIGGISDLAGKIIDSQYHRSVTVEAVDPVNLQPLTVGIVTMKKITIECWRIKTPQDEQIIRFEFYMSSGG